MTGHLIVSDNLVDTPVMSYEVFKKFMVNPSMAFDSADEQKRIQLGVTPFEEVLQEMINTKLFPLPRGTYAVSGRGSCVKMDINRVMVNAIYNMAVEAYGRATLDDWKFLARKIYDVWTDHWTLGLGRDPKVPCEFPPVPAEREKETSM